jgi:hypothetical protein
LVREIRGGDREEDVLPGIVGMRRKIDPVFILILVRPVQIQACGRGGDAYVGAFRSDQALRELVDPTFLLLVLQKITHWCSPIIISGGSNSLNFLGEGDNPDR